MSESSGCAFREAWQPAKLFAARREAERRRARRFALEIPAVFRWMDGEQMACEGAGFCRDISTRGVFVVTFSCAPPLACKLDLMVLLPSLNPRAHTLRLHSSGSVVRVEALGEGMGIGIASLFGDFDDSDRPASSLPEEENSVHRSQGP